MNLENFLSSNYNQDSFETFLKDKFAVGIKDTRFKSDDLNDVEKRNINSYRYLGKKRMSDRRNIGFFTFEARDSNIENKRVGFSAILKKLGEFYTLNCALVAIYHSDSKVWRLSFVSFVIKDGALSNSSDLKRYTYVLGESIPIKTPKEQLSKITSRSSSSELKEAFSVEALNDRFFEDYKKLFIALSRYFLENNFANFARDEENIRAFSKKLLGRITFLYFLQKKGWLGVKENWGDGDKNFLQNSFFKSRDKNFYEEYLRAIFFEGLSTKREDDRFELLDCKLPFLNGGLFESKKFDNEFLHIDNAIFENIFEIFSRYNFTIIEDLPHDSEVAVDPEMLGKVFENLLEDNYKSKKGAFYTPREIVHYMCKESIFAYLITDFTEHEEAIRELVYQGRSDNDFFKRPKNARAVEQKIKSIKILDPAIGSGAFPMGMLTQLVEILQSLNKTIDIVQAKIDIIEQSIYGIDIDASAVEIAQLRFWLSIVVDGDEPQPLPNLDYKIMIGNSLIDTINGFDPLKNRKNLSKKLDRIDELFHIYYNTHSQKEKGTIKNQISSALDPIFKSGLDKFSNQLIQTDNKRERKKNIEEIETHNLLKVIKSDFSRNQYSDTIFLYKLFFREVINSGGFNIIIGNPPYLRVQGIDKEVSKQYKKQFKSAFGSYDLYVLFVEKGLSLLAEDGILNYIMPHKWINSAFGKGLREVSKEKLFKFISFGAYQVFNASTYTSLVWFKNKKVKTLDYVQTDKDLLSNKALESYLFNLKHDDYTHIKNSKLTKESWVFTDKNTYEILQKLNRQPLRVKDVFEKIFTGLQTSKDSVYILENCNLQDDTFTGYSKELNKNIVIEKGLVKPLLKGSDVKRYERLRSNKVVIFPYYTILENDKKKAILYTENEIKERFPNGYQYLKECEDILRCREKGRLKNDDYWFRYIYPKSLVEFEQKKIVSPDITLGMNLSIDNDNYCPKDGTYGILINKKYEKYQKFYLSILNSKLLWWFLKNTGTILANGYFRFKTTYLNPFPLPRIENIEDTKPFETLVDYIMLLKTLDKPINEYVPNEHIVKSFEEVIDAMVYELYFKEEFESKIIQFEKEKGYIKFIEYAKEDYSSIDGLNEIEAIEEIQKSYSKLKEPYNKIRNNLILLPIHFKESIKPIMESL